MEKIIRKWLLLSAALFSLTAAAQDYTLQIRLTDGTTRSIAASQIASIAFRQNAQPLYDDLAGQWLLIASPVGIGGDDGIYTAKTDTIRFEATPAADGSCLMCHTESLYAADGITLQADWQMVAEQNNADGTMRIGLVLSADRPAATLADGTRLYLLSENIATSRLEGMTLWSAWGDSATEAWLLPKNQEIYAVGDTSQPFSGSTGKIFEIWASARLARP
jgi:hypothetical protein